MGVVRAKIQPVEDIYQLLRTACGSQASHSRRVWRRRSMVVSAQIGPESQRATSSAVLSVRWTERPLGCKRPAHQPTGVISRWRSSAGWSCSKGHGRLRLNHADVRRGGRRGRKISQFPGRRRKDSEATARAVGGRGQCVRWRWTMDYASRGERGDPRGRKSGGGSGADSPTWPARAEGEKRFRSAIRNPYAAIHKVA
jgi:hypothetical protein